jgi:uncharacterized membrane protein
MKPFTTIGGLVLLLIAVVQAVRAFLGFEVIIDGYAVPVMASWVVAIVLGLLSLMVLGEARR